MCIFKFHCPRTKSAVFDTLCFPCTPTQSTGPFSGLEPIPQTRNPRIAGGLHSQPTPATPALKNMARTPLNPTKTPIPLLSAPA